MTTTRTDREMLMSLYAGAFIGTSSYTHATYALLWMHYFKGPDTPIKCVANA